MKKILIVDDEDFCARITSRYLEEYYVEVISAKTAREAEEKFLKNPDIAFVAMDGDLKGGGDTFALTKKIKSEFPSCILIAISSMSSFRAKLIEEGCVCGIEKDAVYKEAIVSLCLNEREDLAT